MPHPPEHYHLSREQLRLRFKYRVRRFVFEGHTPSATPVIVFLGGQPAAGKTRAQATALRRYPEMVEIVGDDLRHLHPAYDDLMKHDPLAVADATAQASGAWVSRSLDHAYEHDYSVVVEGTFRNPQMTLDTLERFAKKGYRTEVVALATREDRSRLDKVSRYLDPLNEQPRWAANSHHDLAYEKVPETVQACEDSPYLGRITVTNRAGADLFSNERAPDGQWSRPPGAAEAIHRERAIPPGQDEARDWISDYQRHCRTIVDRGELNTTTLPTFKGLYTDADRNAGFAYPSPADAESRQEHTQEQRVQHRILESASAGASPETLREERRQADQDRETQGWQPQREGAGQDEAERTPESTPTGQGEREADAAAAKEQNEHGAELDDKLRRIRETNEVQRTDRGDTSTEAEATGRTPMEQGERSSGQELDQRDREQRRRDLPGRDDGGIER